MGNFDLSTTPVQNLTGREWLVTNQLGGYASSSLPGLNTRKYHGLLVAAMSPPVHRMVILSRVEERVVSCGRAHSIANSEYPGTIFPQGYSYLRAFSHEPFPRWAYQGDGWTIEKTLHLLRGENTACLSYTLLGGNQTVELELRPLFALRGIHQLTYQWNGLLVAEQQGKAGAGGGTLHHIPATSRTPEAFFAHDGKFTGQPLWYLNHIYRREQERGYAGLEDLWTPGVVRWTLAPGQTVHFVCSTDPVELDRVVRDCARQAQPLAARDALPAVADALPDANLEALVCAADQFVVKGRDKTTRIIAGYPWAPPSGRDAMISLPGLLLVTGRLAEAKSLLQYYVGLLDRGLMPSEFPTDGSAPRYEAADTSLWFIHAAWQYLRYGGDTAFVERTLIPAIDEILRAYRAGTALGIRLDAEELLATGQPGLATTWMDARTVDAVMTPRDGRPVEINALWFSAQRIGAELLRATGQTARADELVELASRTRVGFNLRFWNTQLGYCNDVVGDDYIDTSLRPNQLLAISLPFAALAIDHHAAVLDKVRGELLTSFGLRTLTPLHPLYCGRYGGPVIARDSAHHQGSAFPWLLGPYIAAMLRVRGRSKTVRTEAAQLLQPCLKFLADTGLGQLTELFDGNAPHTPGGLTASARSVAELLRTYVEDVLDLAPPGTTPSAELPPPGQGSEWLRMGNPS